MAPSADLDITVHGIVFSAAGTAGQRCTSLRRLIVHSSVAETLTSRIVDAYKTLSIGSPTLENTLVGPLINEASFDNQQKALADAVDQGGTVLYGGSRVLGDDEPAAYCVEPAVVRMPGQTAIGEEGTFAPILYVMTYDALEEAIEIHNGVPRGLSSATSLVIRPRRRSSSQPVALTVGSSMSISAPRVQRLVEHSAARRRLVVAANPRRRLEGLHAPCHQHHQLLWSAAARPGREVRLIRLLDPIRSIRSAALGMASTSCSAPAR